MKVSKKAAALMLLIVLLSSLFFACTKKDKLTALVADGPVISSVAESNITTTTATITWSTDIVATSKVYFGTSSSEMTQFINETDTGASMTKTHSINLTGLTAATTYYYYVQSRDANLNTAKAGDDGSFSFVTNAIPSNDTAPTISAVSPGTPNADSATITWTTDQSADSLVEYGTSTSYGLSESAATLTTSHSVTLSNLTASTTYHYRVKSTNAASKSSTSSDYTFATTDGGSSYPLVATPPANGAIYLEENEQLSAEGDLGYDMGVASSGGATDWVTNMTTHMKCAYPAGNSWGTVFILRWPTPWNTEFNPNEIKYAFDYSGYTTLSVDMKGEVGGEVIQIGMKDTTDGDLGLETKKTATLTTTWTTYTFALSGFTTCDKTKTYIPIEFVWGATSSTVYFKNIKMIP